MVETFRVIFRELEWQSPMPGVRFKAFRSGNKQIRLAEFSNEFVEPDWCEKGHMGYVMEGSLEIDFNGKTVTYKAGDGLVIPPGTGSKHKARSLTPVTRLVLVEDVLD